MSQTHVFSTNYILRGIIELLSSGGIYKKVKKRKVLESSEEDKTESLISLITHL